MTTVSGSTRLVYDNAKNEGNESLKRFAWDMYFSPKTNPTKKNNYVAVLHTLRPVHTHQHCWRWGVSIVEDRVIGYGMDDFAEELKEFHAAFGIDVDPEKYLTDTDYRFSMGAAREPFLLHKIVNTKLTPEEVALIPGALEMRPLEGIK